MIENCDNSVQGSSLLTDGANALAEEKPLPPCSADKKKSRRKKKKTDAQILTQASASMNVETVQTVSECPDEAAGKEPAVPSDYTDNQRTPATVIAFSKETEEESALKPLGDTVTTQARQIGMEGSGIIFEIAEELYRKEKTQSEIEALCHPPFRKQYDTEKQKQLDREAHQRTEHLIDAAAAARELTFLPEGVFTDAEKPISTLSAFVLQLIFFVPLLNLAAALWITFGSHANVNLKSYSKAFIIWSSIVLGSLLIFFVIYFFQSQNIAAIIGKMVQFFSSV